MSLSSEEYKKLMEPIEEKVRHVYNKGYNDGVVDTWEVVKADQLRQIIKGAVYQAVSANTAYKPADTPILTNLDWVRSLSAEELASWIYGGCKILGKRCAYSEKWIVKWLKEERFNAQGSVPVTWEENDETD